MLGCSYATGYVDIHSDVAGLGGLCPVLCYATMLSTAFGHRGGWKLEISAT